MIMRDVSCQDRGSTCSTCCSFPSSPSWLSSSRTPSTSSTCWSTGGTRPPSAWRLTGPPPWRSSSPTFREREPRWRSTFSPTAVRLWRWTWRQGDMTGDWRVAEPRYITLFFSTFIIIIGWLLVDKDQLSPPVNSHWRFRITDASLDKFHWPQQIILNSEFKSNLSSSTQEMFKSKLRFQIRHEDFRQRISQDEEDINSILVT